MKKDKYIIKHFHLKRDDDAKFRGLEVQKSDFYMVLNKLIDLNYMFIHRNDENYASIGIITQDSLEYKEVCNLLNLCGEESEMKVE